MFVAHDVLLNVTFGVARSRLVSLARTRALVGASRAAYQEGLTSQSCATETGAGASGSSPSGSSPSSASPNGASPNGASPNGASPNGASSRPAGQIRAGPGARSGVQLARVRFLPPVERADSTTIGMRWEASGVSAGLFPILDADITLAAAGEHTTMLTLSGVYRLLSGYPGPALLSVPISAVTGPPAPPPSAPPPAPGLEADAAVRALLRRAASYLTR